MDSLKISTFLFERIQETLLRSDYIETVNLDFGVESNFGNEYIKISYTVGLNELYRSLSVSEQSNIFNGTPECIFSISTYSNMGRGNFRKELLRLIEFKYIYNSLASYITLQLERVLNSTASIKIKGVDKWPYTNYAELYLSSPVNFNAARNPKLAFIIDVSQWYRLHELAHNAKKNVTEQNDYFRITDVEIRNRLYIDIHEIRYLLLRHEVPIKISGIKIIEKIHIHIIELLKALKKDVQNDLYDREKHLYHILINYLYDTYLNVEKTALIDGQKSNFLKQYLIQKGDVLQLKDDRIVVADSIEIGRQNEIIVEYFILKVNLTISTRKRKIPCKNVVYILKKEDFLEYKNYTSSNRIVLLKKWMTRRKKKVDYSRFEPNLMKE